MDDERTATRGAGADAVEVQRVREELLRSRAVRELGRCAMAYILANKEAYISWHVAEYGRRPEGF